MHDTDDIGSNHSGNPHLQDIIDEYTDASQIYSYAQGSEPAS